MKQILAHLNRSFVLLAALASTLQAQRGGVTSFCQSGAGGAEISASGSTNFGLNGGSGDLVLHATGLPAGALGLFFYASDAQPPMPLGNGFLCLGGGSPIWRLSVVSPPPGSDSVVSALDYLSPPSPAAQILPGSTWNFQFWYRAGASPDTTQGLRIQFVPPIALDPVVEVMHALRSGHPLGQTTGGALVLNTQSELRGFWDLHTSLGQPPPPLPSVDMTQSTVIAVFIGRRFSTGYDVQITGVELSVTSVVVYSDETTPCGGGLFSETNPVQLVAVRKIPGAALDRWIPTVLACP